MRLQVKNWGNSKAIRLPKDFTQAMNLETGDFLELAKIDDQTIKFVVVPNKPKQKRLTLAERIAMTALDSLPVCAEWDTIEQVGGEI
ncbi:AbrB/MazE/SpoVT family DNA-binding domain-containing protein [Lonepinella koalarum]|uniref:Antitoxin ChpS n=1 Tax=Lonepinella koalarum TaxID=53417 RepID=A0A4R1KX75_9PAST|nr:AbrB/MazE/SpoVT family DNA-binding domain-containing protein [Lonepinella koalarum]MDH2927783.1 antitoxin MazE [Lonepinella koalarum]TCK69976.1 antitoxin ChpS [Lonepinella koalarum]TFJ90421.1 AbrB/MazE/SpoVT family DNA-binding domain-containing protein [Lonepinella koalarum]